MREFWASTDYNARYCYCMCIVNDDGTAVDDADIASPKVSFFSQPDSGFGEKSVSHITVTDKHVYPSAADMQRFPTYYFKAKYRYGWHKARREIRTYLNTVIETYWVGEEYDGDPTQASWFIRTKHTRPENPNGNDVTFVNREWWCSADYAREYGYGSTHGVDHSARFAYKVKEGHDLFHRYVLTREQALDIYKSIAPQHDVPAGLLSELYRTAMNSITCNTNSIANILEVVDTIKDVKNGNIGALVSDIPKYLKSKQFKKAASSSWLGYRYAYNTTKSDIAEYKEKLLPLFDQKTGRHIVRSGMATDEGIAHCKVIYSDRALNSAQELYVMLKRTGLCLDAYNIWDMIPLSFIADWFLPIGDFLEDFSQNWVADSAIFDIATVTTSWKWSHTIRDNCGEYEISYYSRSVTTEPPEFESYSEDPSTKTILKRVVDAAALIVG